MMAQDRGTPQEQWIKQHPGRVFRHYEDMICVVPMELNLRDTPEIRQTVRERLAEGVRQTYRGSHETVVSGLVEQCFAGRLVIFETGQDYMERSLGVVLHS